MSSIVLWNKQTHSPLHMQNRKLMNIHSGKTLTSLLLVSLGFVYKSRDRRSNTEITSQLSNFQTQLLLPCQTLNKKLWGTYQPITCSTTWQATWAPLNPLEAVDNGEYRYCWLDHCLWGPCKGNPAGAMLDVVHAERSRIRMPGLAQTQTDLFLFDIQSQSL